MMKKFLSGFFVLIFSIITLSAQEQANALLDKCRTSAGSSAKYLKDFRIQLREGIRGEDFRYITTISLSKGIIYRFTLCNDNSSKGKLIMNLRNSNDKVILSSLDEKTGSMKVNVDFKCKKSGLYKICCDFSNGQSGSGIAMVSVLK